MWRWLAIRRLRSDSIRDSDAFIILAELSDKKDFKGLVSATLELGQRHSRYVLPEAIKRCQNIAAGASGTVQGSGAEESWIRKIIPKVATLLSNSDSSSRKAAIGLLQCFRRGLVRPELIERCIFDDEQDVREAAKEAMDRLSPQWYQNPKLVSAYREKVIDWLKQTGTPESSFARKLADNFQDPEINRTLHALDSFSNAVKRVRSGSEVPDDQEMLRSIDIVSAHNDFSSLLNLILGGERSTGTALAACVRALKSKGPYASSLALERFFAASMPEKMAVAKVLVGLAGKKELESLTSRVAGQNNAILNDEFYAAAHVLMEHNMYSCVVKALVHALEYGESGRGPSGKNEAASYLYSVVKKHGDRLEGWDLQRIAVLPDSVEDAGMDSSYEWERYAVSLSGLKAIALESLRKRG